MFAPGFFTSGPVHTALALGGMVALVCGAVGVFAVIRGQAFAGEALGDIGAAGGSASYLAGVAPVWGFVVAAIGAAGAMELLGVQRARGRDLATGIVLGASLGLAALFLYLDSVQQGTAGATVSVLFGSLFILQPSLIPAVTVLGLLAAGLVLALQRPLMLSSLNPDLADVRGVPVRAVALVYLLALALSVALAALTIGAILGTALVVGPAAAALRLTRRPGRAVLISALIGLAAVWLGIVLAYDSYLWPPRGRGWPVSFFVVADMLAFYLLAGLRRPRRERRPERTRA